MPSAHGTGQQGETQLPSQAREDRFFKEKPGVRPVSGTGAFQRHGQAEGKANFPERGAITLPALFVKINRQQMAHLVPAQGVEAGDEFSPQMRLDDLLV